jgi:hypothetical protein
MVEIKRNECASNESNGPQMGHRTTIPLKVELSQSIPVTRLDQHCYNRTSINRKRIRYIRPFHVIRPNRKRKRTSTNSNISDAKAVAKCMPILQLDRERIQNPMQSPRELLIQPNSLLNIERKNSLVATELATYYLPIECPQEKSNSPPQMGHRTTIPMKAELNQNLRGAQFDQHRCNRTSIARRPISPSHSFLIIQQIGRECKNFPSSNASDSPANTTPKMIFHSNRDEAQNPISTPKSMEFSTQPNSLPYWERNTSIVATAKATDYLPEGNQNTNSSSDSTTNSVPISNSIPIKLTNQHRPFLTFSATRRPENANEFLKSRIDVLQRKFQSGYFKSAPKFSGELEHHFLRPTEAGQSAWELNTATSNHKTDNSLQWRYQSILNNCLWPNPVIIPDPAGLRLRFRLPKMRRRNNCEWEPDDSQCHHFRI